MNCPAQPIPTAERRQRQPSISCVVPAYNEGEGISHFLKALAPALSALSPQFEIVVVDDGSRDDTCSRVEHLIEQLPLRLVQLSRNFGKETALAAGLAHTSGQVVIIIDADFQHPLALLPDFLQQWRLGYDNVFGLRASREDEAPLKRHLTRLFYRLLSRNAQVDIPPDAGDFRLLDRQVVDALNALPERARFMKGLYAWVGYRSVGIPFQPANRHAGSSTFNFGRLLELAITGMTSFTDMPLRIWSVIGAAISLLAICYAGYETMRTLLFGADIPGWTTLTVAITFLGGVQLLSIGVLGEYVSRIFEEVKQRPLYIVARKLGFPEAEDGK